MRTPIRLEAFLKAGPTKPLPLSQSSRDALLPFSLSSYPHGSVILPKAQCEPCRPILTRQSHCLRVDSTCLIVVHPVQHDLWRPVPPCSHISGHLLISLACQPKVQDLEDHGDLVLSLLPTSLCGPTVRAPLTALTLSSQSSFTATLLGFRSCRVHRV